MPRVHGFLWTLKTSTYVCVFMQVWAHTCNYVCVCVCWSSPSTLYEKCLLVFTTDCLCHASKPVSFQGFSCPHFPFCCRSEATVPSWLYEGPVLASSAWVVNERSAWVLEVRVFSVEEAWGEEGRPEGMGESLKLGSHAQVLANVPRDYLE